MFAVEEKRRSRSDEPNEEHGPPLESDESDEEDYSSEEEFQKKWSHSDQP